MSTLVAERAHRAQWKASVLGALNLLIAVAAVRVVVLVAIAGGIVLTSIALSAPDLMKLGVLAIYAAMLGAVVWLASRN